MLNYRFDEIRMKDSETFDEIYYFYAKLNDIAICNFNIREKIPEQRIVRKVMRSLPDANLILPKLNLHRPLRENSISG